MYFIVVVKRNQEFGIKMEGVLVCIKLTAP